MDIADLFRPTVVNKKTDPFAWQRDAYHTPKIPGQNITSSGRWNPNAIPKGIDMMSRDRWDPNSIKPEINLLQLLQHSK